MAKKPKAVQPDNDTAPAGHNSGEGEDRKILFFDHYRPIAAQLEKVRAEQAEYKRLRKIAKAANIALWEIDYALRCAEVEDETIIPNRIKRETEIAAWFALPVDFQPDMFGDFSREHGEDRARREGRKAGLSGVGGNPYDEHTPLGLAWADEWAKEQAKARASMQAAMDKANAEQAELIKGSGDDPLADPNKIAAE